MLGKHYGHQGVMAFGDYIQQGPKGAGRSCSYARKALWTSRCDGIRRLHTARTEGSFSIMFHGWHRDKCCRRYVCVRLP